MKPPCRPARGCLLVETVRFANGSQQTFALRFLARQFPGAAYRLGLFARFLFRRLFVMLLELHFPKNAFALELFLQRTQRLIDIIVANTHLHVVVTTFLS